MHVVDIDKGFWVPTVSSQGAHRFRLGAWPQRSQNGKVAVSFSGDGSVNQALPEAMNMAVVLQAPLFL